MSLRLPGQPMSSGAEGRYQRALQEHARQHQQMGHTTGAGDLTTHGFLPRRVPPKPQGSSTPSTVMAGALNMVFRGEWHSSLNFNAQDVVIIFGGTNAGLYVATEIILAGNAEPGTAAAVGWVMISPSAYPGIWR